MDNAPASPPPATPAPSAVPAYGAPPQRPTGVTILAILGIVFGAFSILGGLAAMAGGALLGTMGGAAAGVEGAALGGLVLFAGLIALIAGVLGVVSGIGLWQRKRWGWFIAMGWTAFNILGALLSMVQGNVFGALVSLAIAGFVAWYLLSPAVQSWFGLSYNTPWKYKPAA